MCSCQTGGLDEDQSSFQGGSREFMLPIETTKCKKLVEGYNNLMVNNTVTLLMCKFSNLNFSVFRYLLQFFNLSFSSFEVFVSVFHLLSFFNYPIFQCFDFIFFRRFCVVQFFDLRIFNFVFNF